jgi:lysozyme family protein
MLYLLEKYNGFGYRLKQLSTPYLWSFSNFYTKEKFVADGVFNPERYPSNAPLEPCTKLS